MSNPEDSSSGKAPLPAPPCSGSIPLDSESLVFLLWVPTTEVVRFQAIIDMSEGLGTPRTPKLSPKLSEATARYGYSFLSVYTTRSMRDSLLNCLMSLRVDISWLSVHPGLFEDKVWEELENFIKVELT